jgi:hypothetical protein
MNNELATQQQAFSPPSLVAETASSAVAAQAKAIVEARYVIAIRRPRDWDVVREKMLKECRRPSFAAVARYQKPIGPDRTKWPTGPSIRFAEAAVRNMTNITVETMMVYDDREKRIVRVTVTDLEANVPYSDDVPVQKTIERRKTKDGDVVIRTRTNSYGDTLYILEATDDDILNKQRALVSKAVRTLGLRLIPGDIVDECMDAVVETQRNADAQDPDAAKRRIFDAFGEVGVRAEQVKEYLGHDASTLSPKELTELRALYAAIRDGEATWRDVMETRAEAQTGAAPKGGEPKSDPKQLQPYPEDQFQKNLPGWLKAIVDKKKTADQIIATVQTKHQLTDAQKAQIRGEKPAAKPEDAKGDAAAVVVTFKHVADAIAAALKAKDDDALAAAGDLIGAVADPEQRKELAEKYRAACADAHPE